MIKTGHPPVHHGRVGLQPLRGARLDIARVDGADRQRGLYGGARAGSEIADMHRRPAPDRGRHAVPDRRRAASSPTATTRTTSTSPSTEPPPAGFKADVAATAPAAAPPAATPAAVAEAAAAAEGQAAATRRPSSRQGRRGDGAAQGRRVPSARWRRRGRPRPPRPPWPPGTASRPSRCRPGDRRPAATAAGGAPLARPPCRPRSSSACTETGCNTGVDVDKFLASAGVAPGNPWCASFVTWSLEQSGHKMDGGGWAAVQTWVRNAEAGTKASGSSAPTRPAPATSSPTTGATTRTSGPMATSGSWPATSTAASSPPWRATTRTLC